MAASERDETYRDIFDRAAIGIAIVDLDGRVRTVNHALCDMLGYSSAELVGRPFPDSIRPNNVEAREIRQHLLTMAVDGFQEETQYVGKDGRLVHGLTATRLVRDAGGQPTHFVSQIIDITTLRRVEEALRDGEEKFRVAFESTVIGMAIVGLEDGRVRAINRPYCEMLGYTEQEMLGLDFLEITHPDDVKERAWQMKRLLAEGKLHFEKRYIHKDGRTVWALLGVSLAHGSEGDYIVAQVTDITARKEAEAALEQHAAALERSNTDLEQFAYVASHDLQQPLRAVGSYAQLLSDRYRDQIDDRGIRWLGHISTGIERMQRLINDLLMLARVRTDGSGFSPTDTDAIVRRVWSALEMQNWRDQSTLTITAPLPTLGADPAQIEVLFQNLLGNAFKYRRIGAPLELVVSASESGHDSAPMWEFTVRDNGIGFSMEHAEHIFEIFRRLHREGEGAGIGLAICKKIVTRHGGRICVVSVLDEGSTFSFTLRGDLA